MATKKVPDPQAEANPATGQSEPAALVNACRTLFGAHHPEDVIGPIEWGTKALIQIGEILAVIAEIADASDGGKMRRIRILAESARYLADDMSNTMDAEHEGFRRSMHQSLSVTAGR